jgi:predicted P-loop ATPase
MLILEGGQGLGKSTLAALLGGEWFADTGLVLGDKDSYQNLQGVLVYEWGELDSLTRSEVTKVKQFISSTKDRFRASFDRRPKDYPRQVVFIGTTNESHYLSDPTGNRRFWPVRVTRFIDLDWLKANLAQLFAEALHHLAAGDRFHPTLKEQNELFDPQQLERTVENALESAIRRYLYDENQKQHFNGLYGWLIDEVTLADLLSALSISVDKQTQVLTKQASAALGRMGWERGRASGKGGQARPWVYRRPKGTAAVGLQPSDSDGSTRPTQGDDTAGADDDCPF